MDLVLRRAAEIEETSDSAAAEQVSAEEIERAGVEAGLSSVALRQALAEVRSGALVAPPAAPGFLDRAFGPTVVVLERVVPGTATEVNARLERHLRDALLVVK